MMVKLPFREGTRAMINISIHGKQIQNLWYHLAFKAFKQAQKMIEMSGPSTLYLSLEAQDFCFSQ